MTNILITGISGFVGSNLVEYLSMTSNYKLYGLDIVQKDIPGVEQIYAWEKLHEIPNIDVLIHLAGKAHDTSNTSDPQSYFEVNTELTKKVYDWYLKSTATQFYFMSSVKAVVDTAVGVVEETVIPNPITAYGQSKFQAEEYLREHTELMGKQVYIFRPCMIHGPQNKGNLNLLYKIVSKGIPWPLGAFDNRRSFLSIENLCFVFMNFIEHKPKGGLYHLADDDPLSTNTLIKILAEVQGRKARILSISQPLVKLFARLGDLLHLPLNTERLKKLTENYVVSNTKLNTAIGTSLPVSSQEGLARTFKSFLQ